MKKIVAMYLCVSSCVILCKVSNAQPISIDHQIVYSSLNMEVNHPEPNYQVAIMLPAKSSNQSSVSIQIVVRNVSKITIQYFTKGYAKDFQFAVTDQYGHHVPLTKCGHQLLMPSVPTEPLDNFAQRIDASFMNVDVSLKAGMKVISEVPIGEMFDLSHFGMYHIRVSMVDGSTDKFVSKSRSQVSVNPLNRVVIESNTLSIMHNAKGFMLGTQETE